MRNIRIVSVFCLVLVGAGWLVRPRAVAAESDAQPVAVCELFTSEGCSSCPPADDLLTELTAEAERDDKLLVPLAFHVDYWDQLGWPDRFAGAAATRRQYDYARQLAEPRVYTPQLIVNGRAGFVGSDAAEARRRLAAAWRQRPLATLRLAATARDDRLELSWSTVRAPARGLMLVALTEDGLSSEVTAGENEGRTLRHSAVVREFAVTAHHGDGANRATLDLPADVDRSRSWAVGVLFDRRDGSVAGAVRISLAE